MANLVEVEDTIRKITEGGQSFTLDGFTYSAANMGDLIDLRAQLRAEEQRSNGQRPLFRAFKGTGMAYSGGDTSATPTKVINYA